MKINGTGNANKRHGKQDTSFRDVKWTELFRITGIMEIIFL